MHTQSTNTTQELIHILHTIDLNVSSMKISCEKPINMRCCCEHVLSLVNTIVDISHCPFNAGQKNAFIKRINTSFHKCT
jgi:hypothetical protein